MHINDEAPPLNPWPFLAGDAVLLATAFLISWQANAPLTGLPLIAITVCVGLGAILAVIPFVLNHTRRQDLALADRQREISALAQTTASSAEQISIAAASLHTLADHTARALKLGEALPHKLQEKINDFKAQLNEVAVTDNEALSQEINTLRTSETERLETALAGVRKTALELSSFEATAHKHLKELNDSLARFAADAGKSAADAAKNIESARAAAEKSLASTQAAALAALQESVNSALASLDRKFSLLAENLSGQIATAKTSPKPATAPNAVPEKPAALPEPATPFVVSHSKPPASAPPSTPTATRPPVEPSPSALAENSHPKSHASEPAPAPAEKPTTRPPHSSSSASASPLVSNSKPPVFTSVTATPRSAATREPAAEDVPTALLTEEKPARKHGSRKPATTDNELTLGIELPEPASEFSQVAPDEATPAVSADGLTRLLVTAYIGIGNKLYVRGKGPGLTWDRGVPLQFVSIGKWRWESPDATSPVQLKLYKNDTQECSAVGTVSITPGHQHEVTASFA